MDNQIGAFIRLHREQTQPTGVGLRLSGPRRTPGLRREELAQLCGVSPTWLTWLEQGRPVSASAKVLGRLADAMSLTAAERAYLFKLADKLDPREPGTSAPAIDADAIVKAISTPAYVLNRQWDAIAWNRAAKDLFVGWLDGKPDKKIDAIVQPNLLRYMFLSSQAPMLITDWQDRAERLVAEFRADCGRDAEVEPLARLIESLKRDSEPFRRLWNLRHVVGRDGGMRQFLHKVKGRLIFEQITLQPASARDIKVVILLPALMSDLKK